MAIFSIDLQGKVWPTSEHYFQAQKFADTLHAQKVIVRAVARSDRLLRKHPGGDWRVIQLTCHWSGLTQDTRAKA
ncbi:MAG: NADAR family protein [Drouetiella hepatica Uher 2000/2452]|uniref:NADAR family protein n=1 Tax=Drouetiella hepatica Uher 2000/2452 TaxID=904376 RepID=A0A951UPT8_9CYAN|nr:NADAR family protein [Drouetiella hepatica Uher 2000/2452]